MSIVLQGSTSGSITLQEPAIAGNTTINLPATTGTALVAPTALTVPNTTGTVMVSGNMPAFSAYIGTGQALSAITSTKLQYNTETFDTANCFNNTGSTVGGIPAYAFLPNVAGYYQINACFTGATSTSGDFQISISKNGTSVALNGTNAGTSGGFTNSPSTSVVVYLNGSTDYVEVYAYVQNAQTIQTGVNRVFSGCLVRSA